MFNFKTLKSTFNDERTFIVSTKITAYALNKSKKTNKQASIPFVNPDKIYNRTTSKTNPIWRIKRKKEKLSKSEYLFKRICVDMH